MSGRPRSVSVARATCLVIAAAATQAITSCAAVASAIRNAALSPAPAGQIREDAFFSNALGVRKHLLIYLPPSYDADTSRRFSVVYYLHGLSGSEGDWVVRGGIGTTADSLFARRTPEMILVMPDGDDGWYTTWAGQLPYRACADTVRSEAASRFCVEHQRYDDYIATDVVRYIDAHYRTRADRGHRGVAGLSMGGYGAMILSFHYPNVFGAAASHSGVLSVMYAGPHLASLRESLRMNAPEPLRYAATVDEIRPAAGGFWTRYLTYWGTDLARWREADPAHAVEELLRRGGPMPALYFDCGVDDGFIDQNRAFNLELTRLGVAHSYAEWPGAHTWRYWSTHVRESLAWMGERIGG